MEAQTSETYPLSTLHEIPLKRLQPDSDQPRKSFDEKALEELARSVKEHGVLQPILFRIEDDTLIIVAGERRWRAAKKAGLQKIPAIRVEKNFALVALAENMTRESLTAMEEAEALQKVIDKDNIRQVDLAKAIGKAESTISEILKLNNLSETIKKTVRGDKRWTRSILLRLAGQQDKKKQYASFYQIKRRIEQGKPVSKKKATEENIAENYRVKLNTLIRDMKKAKEENRIEMIVSSLRTEINDLIELLTSSHT